MYAILFLPEFQEINGARNTIHRRPPSRHFLQRLPALFPPYNPIMQYGKHCLSRNINNQGHNRNDFRGKTIARARSPTAALFAVLSGHQVAVGFGPDPRQVQAVGIPADANRRVTANQAAIVMFQGELQYDQASGIQSQHPFREQFQGEFRRPRAVLRIRGFVLSPAIM